MSKLEFAKVKVLGFILNDVKEVSKHGKYSKYSKYSRHAYKNYAYTTMDNKKETYDCIIGDGSHIAYRAVLGGGAKMGSEVLVDIGEIVGRNKYVSKN